MLLHVALLVSVPGSDIYDASGTCYQSDVRTLYVLAFVSSLLSRQVSMVMVASDLVRSMHDITVQCYILMLPLSFVYTCLKAVNQHLYLPNKRTTHSVYIQAY